MSPGVSDPWASQYDARPPPGFSAGKGPSGPLRGPLWEFYGSRALEPPLASRSAPSKHLAAALPQPSGRTLASRVPSPRDGAGWLCIRGQTLPRYRSLWAGAQAWAPVSLCKTVSKPSQRELPESSPEHLRSLAGSLTRTLPGTPRRPLWPPHSGQSTRLDTWLGLGLWWQRTDGRNDLFAETKRMAPRALGDIQVMTVPNYIQEKLLVFI